MSKESAMAALTGTPAPSSPGLSAVPNAEPQALQSTPFAQLAKKEEEIVRQRNDVKRDREQIESEKQKILAIRKEYDNYTATKATDPVKALKMLGFTEADIFNYMAGNQPEELSPEQKAVKAAEEAADARIKAFEDSQTKRVQEEQKKSDDALVQGYRREAAKVVESNSDDFKYCNFYGPIAQDLIYETVLAIVKESDGKDVVTPKEAAEMVEQYYREQDEAMSKLRTPATNVEPVKADTTRSRTVTPGFAQTDQPKPTITKTRTLHSATTSTVASMRQNRNETREQKRERLMDALRNGAKP